MEQQTQEQLETFEQPEEDLAFGTDFENSFDSIGADLEAGFNELEDRLNNLDF